MFKACNYFYVLTFLCSFAISNRTNRNAKINRNIPYGFQFGIASSAYQIEGAWNLSGKTESIWDKYTHIFPKLIADESNADVAADSYHFYKDDVSMIHKLGVQLYRFSVSWPRILPTGFSNYVNREGVEFYNNVINELLEKNIEPMITIYHFDLPASLQELGGWANPIMVQYYEDYAKVLFDEFGDRVKYWITLNEPVTECFLGYGQDIMPPKMNIEKIADYLCIHNQLLAHSKVYRLYKEFYDTRKTGKVSLCHHIFGAVSDVGTADPAFVLNFMGGLIAHPIFSVTGDYPPEVKQMLKERSLSEGYFRSRLPEFTPEEIERLKGSADFFALNHYSSRKYYPFTKNESKVSTFASHIDLGLKDVIDPSWELGGSPLFAIYPRGLREVLKWIKESFDNPVVLITENGLSLNTKDELLLDEKRVNYITSYLAVTLDAIYEDDCNVQGYVAWSLIDCFEWMGGYSNTYGLHCVDFTSPRKTRVRKMSAFVYENIIRSRTLKANYDTFIRFHSNQTLGKCRSKRFNKS